MKRAAGADGPVPLARLMIMTSSAILDELHRRLKERGVRDIRPAFGFVLLAAARVEAETTAQDVAALMGITKQAAAKLVDAMVALDLVRRAPHAADARAKRLVLTPHGRHVLRVVEDIYREIEAEWARLVGGRRRLEAVRADLTRALRAQNGGALPAVRPVW